MIKHFRHCCFTGVRGIKGIGLIAGCVLLVNLAWAQPAAVLDENCTVSILNRTVQANAQGSWTVDNVPAFMGMVRARANCLVNGQTVSGQTDFFSIEPEATVTISDFVFTEPDPVPQKLIFDGSAGSLILSSTDVVPLAIKAVYSDGSESAVLGAESGINFNSSNPAIVAVDLDGKLYPQTTGSVLIAVRLEGALAIKPVIVSLSGDTDGDGLPDDVELAMGLDPNDPVDALEDIDKDGLTALQEFQAGTDIRDPDSDNDGVNDAEEWLPGADDFTSNPLLVDTDSDGISDGLEFQARTNPDDANSFDLTDILLSIAVEPSQLDLIFNGIDTEVSQQVQVLGQLSDGSEIDLTSNALTSYVRSDFGIFSFGSTPGEVFAGEDGSATLTVSINGFTVAELTPVNIPVTVSSFDPAVQGSIDIPGYANNVEIVGDYAYVASGSAGITVVDVNDRMNPVQVASLALAGTTIELKALGNALFVAGGEAGLHIVDISTPTSPVVVSTLQTNGIAKDLVVDGLYAYIADGDSGLSIVQVSDLAAPYLMGNLEGLGDVKGVAVKGDSVVLVSDNSLRVIDVSDPLHPQQSGGVSLSLGRDLVIDGDFAYIARDSNGYSVANISDPTDPSIISTDVSSFSPFDVATRDGLAFFPQRFFNTSLTYVNVSDPNSAVFQGVIELDDAFGFPNAQHGTGIALDSSYAYVTTKEFALQDYGDTGFSRLYIAQYRLTQDNRGIAPQVSVSLPGGLSEVVESAPYTLDIAASDDVAVDYVIVKVNGVQVARLTSAPFTLRLLAPTVAQGLSISAEAFDFGGNQGVSVTQTIALQTDVDADGLGDQQEAALGTDPNNTDSDNDGLIDGREVFIGTDPLNEDTDADGVFDGVEVGADADPLDPDQVPVEVIDVAPFDGETDVLESVIVSVTFNESIRRRSVATDALRVISMVSSLDVAGEILLSADGKTLEFLPDELLENYTQYEIRVTGVKDHAGNQIAEVFSASFTTGNFVDTERPYKVEISPRSQTTDVPVNLVVSIEFNEPLQQTSVIDNNVYVVDLKLNERLAGQLSLSTDRRRIYWLPDTAMPVGRYCYVHTGGLSDLYGNVVRSENAYFTTSFAADVTGPQVLAFSMPDGYQSFPTNGEIDIRFDEPLNAIKLSGVELLKDDGSGETIPLSARNMSDGNRLLNLKLATALQPDTDYLLRVAGIEDMSANQMLNPVLRAFRTASGTDTSASQTVDFSMPVGNNVALNASFKVRYIEPVNVAQLTPSSYYLYDQTDAINVDTHIAFSDDHQTLTLVLNEPLKPDHNYFINDYNPFPEDLANHRMTNLPPTYIRTAKAVDDSAPELVQMNIDNASTVMPVNGVLRLAFNEPLSLDCPVSDAVMLMHAGVPVAVTTSLSVDRQELVITPDALLLASSTYELTIDGVCDQSANVFVAVQRTFTTLSETISDVTKPSIVSRSPSPDMQDVPVSSQIIIEFSEMVDPFTVASGVYVFLGSGENRVAIDYSVDSTGRIWTLTPQSPLPAAQQVNISIYPLGNDQVKDLAGNRINTGYSFDFTTEAGNADITPPFVDLVTPADNAVDMSTDAEVALHFSESLDVNTINSDNFALYANGKRIGTNVGHSIDNRTVTLSASLPGSALISVVVDSDVTDHSGNALSDYISLFTTEAEREQDRPSITRVYPGNGADDVSVDKSIIVYSSEPLSPSSVSSDSLRVSQNGVLVEGTVVLIDEHTIRFEADLPWLQGGYIEVFATSNIEDIAGNALSSYASYFVVQADPGDVVPEVVATSATQELPLNPVIEILFNEPLDVSAINSQTEVFRPSGGSAITATLSMSPDARKLSINPVSDLAPGLMYYVTVTAVDVDGNSRDFTRSFDTADAAVHDLSLPSLVGIAPADGAIDIGTNSYIRLSYDEGINPLSFRSGLLAGLASQSVFYWNDNRGVSFVPHEPLPANSSLALTVPAVPDYAGNYSSATSFGFDTKGGPIVDIPKIEISNIFDEAVDVPTGAVLEWKFSTQIDPLTLDENVIYLFDDEIDERVPGQLSVSSDGLIVTFTPDAALAVGRDFKVRMYSVEDLYGNTIDNHLIDFTTEFIEDNSAPELVAFSMPADYQFFPTNGALQLRFNEPISLLQLDGIELFVDDGLNSLVPIRSRTASDANQLITLTLDTLLQANTDYILRVSNIRDTSMNLMAAPLERSFRTAAGVDLTTNGLDYAVPVGDAVALDTILLVHFDEPVNAATITSDSMGLLDKTENRWLDTAVNISVDQQTLTVVASESLKADHDYELRDAIPNPQDLANNTPKNQVAYQSYFLNAFSTAKSGTTVLPEVVLESVGDGYSGLAVNGEMHFLLNKPLSLSCSLADAVSLSSAGQPVAVDTELSADRQTISVRPIDLLAPATSYDLSITGLCDQSANALPVLLRTFTTSADAAVDVSGPVLISSSPVDDALDVGVSTQVVVTFDESLNPIDIESGLYMTVDNERVAVAYSSNSAGTQWTLTPLVPLPVNSLVNVWVRGTGNPAPIGDLAGNLMVGSSYSFRFTTGSINGDTTAPFVELISPADNAVDMSVDTDVVLRFSESLDSSTINNNNFSLFANGKRLGVTTSNSLDNRTVMLSAVLPSASVIAVVVDRDVLDLSGNAHADFISLFTTESSHEQDRPSIASGFPGNGASSVSSDTPIVLLASEPLSFSTVTPDNLRVSQDGLLVGGQISMLDDWTVQFEPDTPWQYGSYIQVFADSGIEDLFGNALTSFSSYFEVVGDTTNSVPSIVATSATADLPLNPVIGLLFSEPLDPTSVNTISVDLRYRNTATIEPSTVSLSGDGLLVEVSPTNDLIADEYYRIVLNVTDLDGNIVGLTSANFTIAELAVHDSVAPTITGLSPAEGLINVGTNARIQLSYDEPINPLSFRSGQLGGNDQSVSFWNDDRAVTLIPHGPLLSEQLIDLAIPPVSDYAGNAGLGMAYSLTTQAGPIVSSLSVVSRSVENNTLDIPTNVVLQWQFSNQVDELKLDENTVYLVDTTNNDRIPATLNLSADAKQVSLAPLSALALDRRYYTRLTGVRNIYGSTMHQRTDYFTTGAVEDITAPQVLAFSMPANYQSFPINGELQVRFDEPLNPAELSGIVLLLDDGSGTQVPIIERAFSDGNRLLSLKLASPLLAETDYLLRVADVEDISVNALSVPVERRFRTASGVDLGAAPVDYVVPVGDTVALNTTLQVHYSEPLNGAIITSDSLRLYDQTDGNWLDTDVDIRTDHLSLNVLLNESMQADHDYYLRIDQPRPEDVANNSTSSNAMNYYFSTVNTVDDAAPTLLLESFPDGFSEVPINGKLGFLFDDQMNWSCSLSSSPSLTTGSDSVPVKVSLDDDHQELTLMSEENLLTSSTYSLSMAGLCDQSGNVLPTITRSFTTGADPDPDVSRPVVVARLPSPAQTQVSVNTAIEVEFDGAIDALTVEAGLYAYIGSTSNRIVVDYSADSTRRIWTLTPQAPLPAATLINVRVGYIYQPPTVKDIAGNTIGYTSYSFSFTTE